MENDRSLVLCVIQLLYGEDPVYWILIAALAVNTNSYCNYHAQECCEDPLSSYV